MRKADGPPGRLSDGFPWSLDDGLSDIIPNRSSLIFFREFVQTVWSKVSMRWWYAKNIVDRWWIYNDRLFCLEGGGAVALGERKQNAESTLALRVLLFWTKQPNSYLLFWSEDNRNPENKHLRAIICSFEHGDLNGDKIKQRSLELLPAALTRSSLFPKNNSSEYCGFHAIFLFCETKNIMFENRSLLPRDV